MNKLFKFLSAALGAALIGAGTMLAAVKIADSIEKTMEGYDKPILGDDDEDAEEDIEDGE